MKISSQTLNRVMIAIGALLVVLMVISSGFTGYQQSLLEKKCIKGDIDVCTRLIESKKLPKKQLAFDYGIRGYYSAKKGEYPNAIGDFNDAIDLLSSDASLYAGRAAVYEDMKGYSNAITDYSTAIDLQPKLTVAWCGRAHAELETGDTGSGGADLAQAMKLDPRAVCVQKLKESLETAPPTDSP